jgi:hypothetical protein
MGSRHHGAIQLFDTGDNHFDQGFPFSGYRLIHITDYGCLA